MGIVQRLAAGSPLKSTSSVQQTQKSFSTFSTAVPNRRAVVRNTSRRSSSLDASRRPNVSFIDARDAAILLAAGSSVLGRVDDDLG